MACRCARLSWCVALAALGILGGWAALEPLSAQQREADRTSLTYVWHLFRMAGKGYTDTFCSRSKDGCLTVDDFPGTAVHSKLAFDTVVEELAETPEREASGQIRRLGDLGYFIFNDLLWSKDWKTFPIGADLEDHRKHRPTADLLMGPDSKAWDRSMVRASAQAFFKDRRSLQKRDIEAWVNKLFHKILLNIDLTDAEEEQFDAYKGSSMMVALLPRWLVSGLSWLLGLGKAREQRDAWIETYEKAIVRDDRGIIPELAGRDRRFLADLLLTAMTSAGGLSVPTVIHMCLGILYGGATSPLQPEGERNLTATKIEPLVLETIRRFPAVVGFPWWSPDQSTRTVLNVAMALRDPRAWGDDAGDFKLRPLSEYHKPAGRGTKIGVAWAEQGIGKQGLGPDSRGCPAKQLSMVMITEFLDALRPLQSEWVVTEAPKDGIRISEGPSAASEFTLGRQVASQDKDEL